MVGYIKSLDLLPEDFDWTLSAEEICDAAEEEGLDLDEAAEEIARDADGVAGPHVEGFRVEGDTRGEIDQITVECVNELEVEPKGRTAIYWVDYDGPTYTVDLDIDEPLDFSKLKFVTAAGYDCRDVITEVEYAGESFFLDSDDREGTSSSAGWDFPEG